MKKILAVFMAVLMVFSCTGIALAADTSDTTKEERTTRDAVDEERGLVVPINFSQFKLSIVFKLIEKIFKFVLKLFAGDKADEIDQSLADDVSSIADDVSKAIEEGSQFIEDNS